MSLCWAICGQHTDTPDDKPDKPCQMHLNIKYNARCKSSYHLFRLPKHKIFETSLVVHFKREFYIADASCHEDKCQSSWRWSSRTYEKITCFQHVAFTRCPNNPSSTWFTITHHYRIFIRIYFGYPNKSWFKKSRRFLANKCKTDKNISGRTRQ